MYKCDIHGELYSEWCDECKEIYSCDCSEHTETRFKDLIIDCEDGERTITIYINHCITCGDVSNIRF